MLFRTLTKETFAELVALIMESTEVIGPKRIGTDHEGEPIHQYLPIDEPGELDLGYQTTEYSAKTYFLPYQEQLSRYRFDGDDWNQEIRYRLQPRALIGLHACDIADDLDRERRGELADEVELVSVHEGIEVLGHQ